MNGHFAEHRCLRHRVKISTDVKKTERSFGARMRMAQPTVTSSLENCAKEQSLWK